MPKLKTAAAASIGLIQQRQQGRATFSTPWRDPRPVGCLTPGCPDQPLAESPVALCGRHVRKVYEFAQDMIAQHWDDAVRDYVSDLHAKFRPPTAVRRKPGNVYFIRFADRVKVGYSENPELRLSALPHDEVIGVIPGTRADERAWHQLLAQYRVTGEWFQADPQVLAHIRKVCAAASATRYGVTPPSPGR